MSPPSETLSWWRTPGAGEQLGPLPGLRPLLARGCRGPKPRAEKGTSYDRWLCLGAVLCWCAWPHRVPGARSDPKGVWTELPGLAEYPELRLPLGRSGHQASRPLSAFQARLAASGSNCPPSPAPLCTLPGGSWFGNPASADPPSLLEGLRCRRWSRCPAKQVTTLVLSSVRLHQR